MANAQHLMRNTHQHDNRDPAQAAHHNLVLINNDLQHQLDALHHSHSYRLARLLVRIARPARRLLRPTTPTTEPDITITATWPALTAHVTWHHQPTEALLITAHTGNHELAHTTTNPNNAQPGTDGRWHLDIHQPYHLGFTPFPPTELRVRIGHHNEHGARTQTGTPDQCRPADAAIAGLTITHGNPDQLRHQLTTTRAVALIATYRNHNRPDATPHRLLTELRRNGYHTVVIDTSEQPAPHDCDLLLHRHNTGWDFASWMATLTAYPWLIDHSDRLLLVNDSTIGPLTSLDTTLNQGTALGADIWGITDSWDISHHIQSYFVHFEHQALRSGHLTSYTATYPYPADRTNIIAAGEIGLSRHLRRHGHRLAVLYPYTTLTDRYLNSVEPRIHRLLAQTENRLRAHHGLTSDIGPLRFELRTIEQIHNDEPLNPTHRFWEQLLELGSPFIKRDLLATNPEHNPGLHRLPGAVARLGALPILHAELDSWERDRPGQSLPLTVHRHHTPPPRTGPCTGTAPTHTDDF